MRTGLTVVLAVIIALVAPGAAFAGQPVRVESQAPTASSVIESCGFPVLMEQEGRIVTKTWYDENNNALRSIETYPGYKITFTNQATGARVSPPTVGPTFTTYNADGSTTTTGSGPWVFYQRNPVTGAFGIFLVRGHFTYQTFPIQQFKGQIDNLCPLLA